MIATHEFLIAILALEVFLSCVCLNMTVQLVRTGKFSVAEGPVTNVRFLSSVGAQMGLEVRCLAVDLTAALVMADVSASFWALAALLDLRAVGADTVGTLGGLAGVRRGEHVDRHDGRGRLPALSSHRGDTELLVEVKQSLELCHAEWYGDPM